MNSVFKKMNFKGHSPIYVRNAPEAFKPMMVEMEGLTEFHENLGDTSYDFVICFLQTAKEVEELVNDLQGKMGEDALLWVAFPKKSSKKYKSEINRDSDAWQYIGDFGYEGVRSVAIDADWSALRFRQTKYIKTMKRNPKLAMSKEGKARVKKS